MTDETPGLEANPYAPPQAILLDQEQSYGPEEHQPIPFEDIKAFPGFWTRVGKTFALAFSSPLEFFRRVPITSGIGAPWRFALLLTVPLLVIMLLIFGLIGFVAYTEAASRASRSGAPAWLVPVIFGGILVLVPLIVLLTMVILGAVNHFCLWIWGGLRQGEDLEQTCRAVGYTYAFTQLVGFVPILGPFAQLGAIIAMGMGLAKMHRTDTWRGVCAALTPVVLCCCGYIAFIATAIASSGR